MTLLYIQYITAAKIVSVYSKIMEGNLYYNVVKTCSLVLFSHICLINLLNQQIFSNSSTELSFPSFWPNTRSRTTAHGFIIKQSIYWDVFFVFLFFK